VHAQGTKATPAGVAGRVDPEPAATRGRALSLLVAVVLLLAGCGRGGTSPAPQLATSAAERAGWPRPPPGAVVAVVDRVVDGDTFVARFAGRSERVRIIGVNTPETVAPGRPIERYGLQASHFAKRFLTGATVRLAGDVEPRDHFGRLLAYVWLADGTFWNALLAAEGYAQQLTIPPNVAYAELFGRLVAEARAARRGLWDAPAAAGGRGEGPRDTAPSTAAAWNAAAWNAAAWNAEIWNKRRRPAVRRGPGSPPTTSPHKPDGVAAATRTCFPRLPVSSRPRLVTAWPSQRAEMGQAHAPQRR
jgi:micrococcal nuclease